MNNFAVAATGLMQAALMMSRDNPVAAIILLTQAIEFIIRDLSQEQIVGLPIVTAEIVALIQLQLARHEEGKLLS